MPGLSTLLVFGFCLGVRHAADPDHVLAVSTFVAREKKLGAAWRLGAAWGLGHMAMVTAVGMGVLLFKLRIPPSLESHFESAVGWVLVVLGTFNILGFRGGPSGLMRHTHPHDHSDPEHAHGLFKEAAHSRGAHEHTHLGGSRFLSTFGGSRKKSGALALVRPALVGLVHGLAGSAAIALLVLGTVRSIKTGALYLLVFGFGTLAGMLGLSTLMELSFLYTVRRWALADRVLMVLTGFASLLFGAGILLGYT